MFKTEVILENGEKIFLCIEESPAIGVKFQRLIKMGDYTIGLAEISPDVGVFMFWDCDGNFKTRIVLEKEKGNSCYRRYECQ